MVDWQLESDLDSIRNSCDVCRLYAHICLFSHQKDIQIFQSPWTPWACTFCAAIPHLSRKRRTLAENRSKTSKTSKKCECFFPNKTIKWDCVDPKCFDRKFGRANTQKANSHNTAAWSLILTTGSVFCVFVLYCSFFCVYNLQNFVNTLTLGISHRTQML